MKGIISSIRSFMAFAVTITFCYLALIDKVDPKDFMSVVVAITVFYFAAKDRNNQPKEQ